MFVGGIDIVYFLCLSFALVSPRRLGASRGFAFVEFNSEEEATRWMEYKQVSGAVSKSHKNKTPIPQTHVRAHTTHTQSNKLAKLAIYVNKNQKIARTTTRNKN